MSSPLESQLERLFAASRAPGLALSIVSQGTELTRGFGALRSGGSEAVTAATLFPIASLTKAFSSLLVAMLVEEGALHWDDRVIDRYPSFRVLDPYVTLELTIRDLLAHRTGLPALDDLWYGGTSTFEDIIVRMRYAPSRASLRSEFSYSNIAYMLLGEIIASACAEPFAAALRRRVLDPLGMHRSQLLDDAPGDGAQPHAIVDGEVQPIAHLSTRLAGAAGGIYSTAAEMTRWLRFWIAPETALVSADSRFEMTTGQICTRPASLAYRFMEPSLQAYGLGWQLSTYRGHTVISHTGNIDGSGAIAAVMPGLRTGVVALANLHDSALPAAVMYATFDHLLGDASSEHGHRILEAHEAERAQSTARNVALLERRQSYGNVTRPLDAYSGAFENELYGVAEIRAVDGTLHLAVCGQRSTLFPLRDELFAGVPAKATLSPGTVQFVFGEDEPAHEIHVRGGLEIDARFTRRDRTGTGIVTAR